MGLKASWRKLGSSARPLAGILAFLVPCGFGVMLALAAPDFDKIERLALQRYGPTGAESISAWRRMMEDARNLPDTEKAQRVNLFFNRRILFASDMEVWHQEDYWATPLEFMGRGAGDCEDFSIAKYTTLKMLGISDVHLHLIYVRLQQGSLPPAAHMVLGYYPDPVGEPLILDNMISSVRPASMRSDLSPVFSFNSAGLWAGGSTASLADPTARLSRWRDVLERMRLDGF